ncbi:MAG: glycosyltransferase family 4 protein [Pseudomonadota bacterium]|jgi:glycosyltransferase involved in cell wall biosynthesis|nr:glycosyltransferase family 4 protein [Alphaproteobacteria bacterium]
MNAVLQVLPSFHTGGVEQTTLLIANALAAKGVRSFIVSSGGILTRKLHPGVIHIEMPLSSKNPFIILKNTKKLRRIIESYSIDIVHARSRAPAWSAYLASRATKAHFLTTYHGAYSQNFFKWYYNQVMAFGEMVIVTSSYMESHVKQHYPNARCVQIASGINTQFFSKEHVQQQKVQELRDFWDIKEDTKIVLLLGRFTPIKGHYQLLQAIKDSSLKNRIKVIFVGDSKNPRLVHDLRRKAKNYNVQLYVHLDESDLRAFFSLADVVVVPTIKPEAFGRVTVEAMSMGNVVIVNDLGASKEIVTDKRWIFDHNSTEDFTRKIDHALLLQSDKKEHIGAANRAHAVKLYNVDILIESHLRLYESFF